ncbi:MAG: hypothetical protein JWQ85_1729 [Mucilaginibacter sp.]|nr:hypothetical protein [Mucilaginibacter sp.]
MVSVGWIGEVCAFTVRDAVAKSITKTILLQQYAGIGKCRVTLLLKKRKLK